MTGVRKADFSSCDLLSRQIAEDLVQNQIYTLFALGSIGDNSAVPGVLEQVKKSGPIRSENRSLRFGSARRSAGSRSDCVPLLNDPKEDVRWNAALALALLGNSEGANF